MSAAIETGRVFFYTTAGGERWDQVALACYGDARLYEPIVRANPRVAILPTLPAGVTLQIPELDTAAPTTSTADLPPWKR